MYKEDRSRERGTTNLDTKDSEALFSKAVEIAAGPSFYVAQ